MTPRFLGAVALSIPLSMALLLALPPAYGAAFQTPPGYYVDSAQVVTSRPLWRDARDGDFTYSVRREFSDSTTGRLLSIAESCYPERDLLVEIAATRYLEMGSDTTKASLWWCDGEGVRRVAWAVTAGALEHYLGMTERFRNHDYLVPGGEGLYFTDLAYHAKITAMPEFVMKEREYNEVYVAYLLLGWSYDDGVSIDSFEAHRIVVLDPQGNVLAVDGDGRALEEYRFSGHIAPGRQQRVYR